VTTPHSTREVSRSNTDRSSRGAALLSCTAAATFFATGAGMLEGHAVYPSWRHLAAFDDFAGYHAQYGLALLPWLPLPLLVATIGTALLIRRRPVDVPRGLVIAALLGQLIVIIVTVTVAIPIQAQLASAGHTPAEIITAVDRLILLSYLREIPGLAVAVVYVVMLWRAIRGGAR
jgi:hypothetical protein